MRICVLQPDYSTSSVDYQYYDPARDLSSLLPNETIDHVFLNKLTVYKQLKDLSKKKYDIFVNLCEGYLEWEIPSIDVIYFLELLNLPFTGPTSILYDPTKELMKYVSYTQAVNTPQFAIVESLEDITSSCAHLRYPLFIKPAKAGDSLGIDEKSLLKNDIELLEKANFLLEEYGSALVEEYIDGREFTVLVVAHSEKNGTPFVYNPVEYIFPEGRQFKTYALKTSELHLEANACVKDELLSKKLKEASSNIFNGFGGAGYARLDFRMNNKGELFFLEINFTCSVFYSNGMEGSADYILQINNTSQKDFLEKIIEEGISRHRRNQKKYIMKGNAVSGYGIYAIVDIEPDEIIFKGEERSQRMATLSHINKSWSVKEIENFKKYAYPISKEVFLLWDENPANWAPQNHSCNANTKYTGLDVVASKKINKGEELTLNYAAFLDESMEPFNCKCGHHNCKGYITGTAENSISYREQRKNF